jgi:hypothetical protein
VLLLWGVGDEGGGTGGCGCGWGGRWAGLMGCGGGHLVLVGNFFLHILFKMRALRRLIGIDQLQIP